MEAENNALNKHFPRFKKVYFKCEARWRYLYTNLLKTHRESRLCLPGAITLPERELMRGNRRFPFMLTWSGRLDSNQRPPDPQPGILPTELRPGTSYCSRKFYLTVDSKMVLYLFSSGKNSDPDGNRSIIALTSRIAFSLLG